MRVARMVTYAVLFVLGVPSVAVAAESGDVVQNVVATGTGVFALLLAIALLVEMLQLRKLAEGAAIGENITYALLGVAALAASVLVGWIARFLPEGFSESQAMLGADLLTVSALVLFGVYFMRVRRSMSKFLKRLTGEAQLLVAALDESAEVDGTGSGGDAVQSVEESTESSAGEA